MNDDLTKPANGSGKETDVPEGASLGEIKGLVQTAAEGGFIYEVPGSSVEFGWKLGQSGSGLLWTDGSYFVLENCVGLKFDDRDVSPEDVQSRATVDAPELATSEDAATPASTHPHDLQRDIAAAISGQSLGFGHDPEDNAHPVRVSEEKIELPADLIPPQLDEVGAEVSFDIGSFLQENMLKGEPTVHLQGLPSGLGYNAARMRVEGRIADDVMTGVPYTVGLTIQLADGATLTSSFSWTIRDTQTVDQSETGSSVVPMLGQRDDGVSAGILFAIAGQSLRVSSAFGLERVSSSSSTAVPAVNNTSSSGLFPIDPVSTGSVSASGQEDSFSLKAAAATGAVGSDDKSDGDGGIDVQAAAAGGTSAARAVAEDEAEAAASKIESDQTPQLPVAVGGASSDKNSLPFAGSGNALTVAEDIPRTGLNLLANAFDADGDVLSLEAVQAEFGTVTVQGDGTVNYVPPADFNGEDTITYTVSDGRGGTDTATVSLNVLAINDAPVGINPPAETILEDGSLTNVDVLAGATDIEGDALLVSQASAINGIAVVNGNGNINYTPFANFSGTDTVRYTISDGNGGTFISQIDITVTSINDAPLAGSPAPVTTDEDISLLGIDVASFASDLDGDTVSVDAGSVTALNGVVSLDGNGRIDYVPNANFNGVDTISYVIVDGQGGSASGSISVTVRSVNDAPIAVPNIAPTIDEDQTIISIDVLSAATDVDGDSLFVEAGSVTAVNGIVSINGDGTLRYSPTADFNGTDTVFYTVTDARGGTDAGQIIVTINPVNDAPTTTPLPAQIVDEDGAIATIDVISLSSDPDGDLLNVRAGSLSASNGTVTLNGDGTLRYTPAANFNGTDAIFYTIEDGNGGSVSASVNVTVNPINDAPVAGNPAPQSTAEDVAIASINVLGAASDVEGDAINVIAGSVSALNGTVIINGDGTLRYTPNVNFSGSDTISYSLEDGNGGATSGTVAVNVSDVNSAPTSGSPAAQITDEDVSLSAIDVLTSASDQDGDALSVRPGSVSALNGTVTINGDGTLNYNPNADYNGSDTISYTVEDGNGGTAAGTVDITISPINDAPDAGTPAAQATQEDVAIATIDVLAAASDADGDILSILPGSVSATNGTVSINGDQTLNYVPDVNFDGIDIITYTIDDGNGGQTVGSVLVTVNDENAAPVAGTPAAVSTDEDVALTSIDVVSSATDQDGDPLVVQPGSQSALNGTVVINGDGTLNYIPDADFVGSDTISYTISDGLGGTSAGTVDVTVTPVNDAPLIDLGDTENAVLNPTFQRDGLGVEFQDWVRTGTFTSSGDGISSAHPGTGGPGATGALTQSGLSGLDDGPGVFGAATVRMQVGISSGSGTVGDQLVVSVGGVDYATITNAAGPGDATISYSNGAAGTLTPIPASTYLAWTYYQVEFDLPASVASSGDVVLTWTNDAVGAGDDDDIAVDTFEIIRNSPSSVPIDRLINYENDDLPVQLVDDTASITDVDNAQLQSARLEITNAQSGDALQLNGAALINGSSGSLPSGIVFTATFFGSSMVIDFTGSASTADYLAALQGVTFTSSSATPSAVNRNVDVFVSDGEAVNDASPVATTTIIFDATQRPTDVMADSGSGAEDNVITVDVLANDAPGSNAIDPATVQITGTVSAGENLLVAGEGNWTINPINGAISFNPEADFNGTPTPIFYSVEDISGFRSADAQVVVTVTAVNDAPTIDLSAALAGTGNSVTYSEGNPAVAIAAADSVVSDPDSDISSITISLTFSGPDDGNDELLNLPTGQVAWGGVASSGSFAFGGVPFAWSYNPFPGELIINHQSGAATPLTVAQVEGLLQALSYQNNAADPSVGFRNFDISMIDLDGATSNVATSTVSVVTSNDAPTDITYPSASVQENSAATTVVATLSAVDSDSTPPFTYSITNDPSGFFEISGNQIVVAVGAALDRETADFHDVVVEVQDSGGEAYSETIRITVSDVNEAPDAGPPLTRTGSEDVPLVITNILDGANDPDGDPLDIIAASSPNGAVLINPDNSLTFSPPPEYSGIATINYTVSDGRGLFDNNTITVFVNDVNDAPVAADDSGSSPEDTLFTHAVLVNDSDIDGTPDPTTIQIVGTLAAGDSLTVAGEGVWSVNTTLGTVIFTPDADYDGPVTPIQYTVRDDGGAVSNPATISHTLTAVNDAPSFGLPVSTLDSAPAFTEGGPATVLDTTVDISDVELDALNAGTGDYHGATLALGRNGGPNVEDVFGFVDGNGISFVGGSLFKNGQTIATFDIVSTPGELAIAFTSANGETPTSADVDFILSQIIYENTSVAPPASVQIDWTFSDGNTGSQGSGGPEQVIGSTTVAITSVNSAPTAGGNGGSVAENGSVEIDVLANDSDIDGVLVPATVQIVGTVLPGQSLTVPGEGVWSINSTTGAITFTPEANYDGAVTDIQYTVQDDGGATSNPAPVSVIINSLNTAPTLDLDNSAGGFNHSTTHSEGTGSQPIASSNVVALDPENSVARIIMTLDALPDGSFERLTVQSPSFHMAVDNAGSATLGSGLQIAYTWTAGTRQLELTNIAGAGTPLSNTDVAEAIESLSYEHVGENPTGGDRTFTFTLQDDGGLLSVPVASVVTVVPVNDPPATTADFDSVSENSSVEIDVLANDTDVDGTLDPTTVQIVGTVSQGDSLVVPGQGTWSINGATGTITFTPEANYDGVVTDIQYTVQDDLGATSNPAAVSVSINSANASPTDVVVTGIQGSDGTAMNMDGGNAAYYGVTAPAALSGLSEFTVEVQFSIADGSADQDQFSLFNYNTVATGDEIELAISTDPDYGHPIFFIEVAGSEMPVTGLDATPYLDGGQHTFAISWNSAAGDWEAYADGALVGSGTGLSTGVSISGGGSLAIGKDQDSPGGSFDPTQSLSGVVHDVRIFDDVRTAGELAASSNVTLAPTEPNLVTNWVFGSGSLTSIADVVGPSDLTLQQVTGAGFTPSTPQHVVTMREDDALLADIASLLGVDPDVGDTFTYTLLDDSSGRFSIAGNVLERSNSNSVSFESGPIYTVLVRVEDQSGGTYDEAVHIYVSDAPENLTFGSAAIFTDDAVAELSVTGSDFDDTFTGNYGDDNIDARAGNDVIYGRAGNDTLTGGLGDDQVFGGVGDDTLRGEGDNDFLEGGAGADVHVGGMGFDTVSYADASTGVDVLFSDADAGGLAGSYLSGSAGGRTGIAQGDSFVGVEAVVGSDQDDRVYGADGDFTANLGGGNDLYDVALSDNGIDTVDGGAGDDVIYGGGGADVLFGGTGNDVLVGEGGADAIDGGADFDTVILNGDAGGNVALFEDTDAFGIEGAFGSDTAGGKAGQAAGDIYTSIEAVVGSNNGDAIYGLSGGFTADLGGGNDVFDNLEASTGVDIIDAGTGNDRVFTGGGNDQVDLGAGDDFASGEAGDDTIDGGIGTDTVSYSGNQADYNITYNPDLSITVTDNRPGSPDGTDTLRNVELLQFADGTMVLGSNAALIQGTPNDDAGLTGGSGGQIVYGQGGIDAIGGAGGNDTLHGQDGADTIDGGSGDDTIFGDREAQVIDSAGLQSVINTTTTGIQSGPVTVALADGNVFVAWYEDAFSSDPSIVKGQIVQPDGTKIGTEFTIGTHRVEGSDLNDLPPLTATRMANGDVFLAWASEGDTNIDGDGQAVVGSIFDVAAGSAGGNFTINTTTAGHQSPPLLAALDNGQTLAVWYDNARGDNSGLQIRGQFLNGDGSLNGTEFLVGIAEVEGNDAAPNHPISIAALSDGNVAVVWATENTEAFDGDGSAIVVSIVDAATQTAGLELDVNTSTLGSQAGPATLALSDGGMLVVWHDDAFGGNGGTLVLRGQFLNDDGSPLGSEFAVAGGQMEGHPDIEQNQIALVELADGNVMLGWQSEGLLALDGSSSATMISVIDTGTRTAGPSQFVNTTSATAQSAPVLTSLHDGRVFATWFDESEFQDGNSVVRGQFLNADGTLDGPELTLGTANAEGDNAIDMPPMTAVATMNGDIFVSWQSENTQNVDGDGTAVVSVLVSTRTTSGNDNLSGDEGNDYISGGDGDDTLTGGAGDDQLLGGSGSDTAVFSGNQADYTLTDLGGGVLEVRDDRVGSPDGTDTLTDINFLQFADGPIPTPVASLPAPALRQGTPNADAFATDSVFTYGQGSDDAITGDGSDNAISGQDGADILDGGAGNDTLVGDRVARLDAVGTQQIINQTTVGDQGGPLAVSLSDGTVLALWYSNPNDGGLKQISGRILNEAGTPVSSEFAVGTSHLEGSDANEQPIMSATLLEDGNVLVGWQSSDSLNVDGDGSATMGSVIDVSVASAGPEFVINTNGTLSQSAPVLTAIDDGGALAVWFFDPLGDNVAMQVRGQFLTADGSKVGGEFIIGTSPVEGNDARDMPPVTTTKLLDGNVAVAWSTNDSDAVSGDGSGSSVAGVIVNSTSRSAGSEFRINVNALTDQSAPVVVSLQGGGFFATWYDQAGSDSHSDMHVQYGYFNADGTLASAQVQPTATTIEGFDAHQMPPLTAIEIANGNVLIAFQSDNGEMVEGLPNSTGLVGLIVDDTTKLPGSEFVINTTTATDQSGAVLVALHDGRVLAVWHDASDQDGSGTMQVRGQFLNADGSKSGAELMIGTSDVEGTDAIDMPPLTAVVTRNGDVLVTWQSEDSFNADGSGSGVVSVMVRTQTSAGADTLRGGDGDDVLFGMGDDDVLEGQADDDMLYGGSGSDVLRGGSGNDSLFGQDDDDELVGGQGADVLDGGAGTDRVSYFDAGSGIDVLLESTGPGSSIWGAFTNTAAGGYSGDALGDSFISLEELTGSDFGDRVFGTSTGMTVDLLDGNDDFSVSAFSTAADTISGGAGNDRIFTGGGNDFLYGGSNDDELDGGAGSDELYGMNDNDTLRGDQGNDTLYGGLGNDDLDGGQGSDTLFGEEGIDTLRGGLNDDFLYGGAGQDTLEGGEGRDIIYGGSEGDNLSGGVGNDDLFGEGGQDRLIGDAGGDILDGGSGNDTVDYSASASGVVSIFSTTDATGIQGNFVSTASGGYQGDAAGDTYTSIETFDGTAFDDQVWGRTDSFTANLGAGDDIYENGASGDDTVSGEAGNDIIVTGGGTDNLNGGTGDDRLQGGGGNDTIDGDADTDTAVYSGNRADYTVNNLGFALQVIDNRPGSPDGTDILFNVELLEFADITIDPFISPDAPMIDADISSPGLNNSTAFFAGGAPRSIVDNGSIVDAQQNTANIQILLGGMVDGGDDVVFLGASSFSPTANTSGNVTIGGVPVNYSFTQATQSLVLTPNGPSQWTDVEAEAILEGIRYDNTSISPTENDRTFAITAMDVDGNVSQSVVTTMPIIDSAAPTTTNTIIGTAGNDSPLNGTSANDFIDGLAGDDVINGFGGDDHLDVGNFNDVEIVNGGDGNDFIIGAGGDDQLSGESGHDYIEGRDGGDTISGGDGSDWLRGGAGSDALTGGAGDDLLEGGSFDDQLTGGAGNDQIDGGLNTDTAFYSGNSTDYVVMDNGDGSHSVTDQRAGSPNGTDILRNVENLQFDDGLFGISAVAVVSPIAFDFDGSGAIEITGETTAQDKTGTTLGGTVEFDMNGDGDLETIEWLAGTDAGSGDGFLVDNRDGNAEADMNGTRLFGDQEGRYEHGYEQLAELDTNADGKIAGDELNGLDAWIDDGDARVETGELFSLEDMGVSEISLQLDSDAVDDEGRDLFRSTAVMDDGSSVMTEDVWFTEDMSQDERLIRPEPVEETRVLEDAHS